METININTVPDKELISVYDAMFADKVIREYISNNDYTPCEIIEKVTKEAYGHTYHLKNGGLITYNNNIAFIFDNYFSYSSMSPDNTIEV